MPRFSCRDTGSECQWEAEAQSKEELLSKIREHLTHDHGINEPSEEILEKLKTFIKD